MNDLYFSSDDLTEFFIKKEKQDYFKKGPEEEKENRKKASVQEAVALATKKRCS